MSLQNWLKAGWLTAHEASRQETVKLLGLAARDLAECQVPGLSPDWQLTIAYNAAMQSAVAALAASGFRAAREAHHYRVIQSLAFTIGADAALVTQLDGFRKKRNFISYERAGATSQQEATEMLALSRRLRTDVEHWLEANHPELLFVQ